MNLKGNIVKKVDMKNNLTVSVVLATYNGEEFLAQQIASILNQTVLPDEMVFVDDGSVDSTISIIYDFIEILDQKGIESKIVQHKKNLGYIDNYFSGIALATKELIFLSDQDDVWEPIKIERNISYFREIPTMIALHGNTNIIDRDNNIIKYNFQEYNKKISQVKVNKFVKKVNYAGMALVFRNGEFKESLFKVKKDIKINTHDWFICLLASLNDGFYVSSEVLTLRRHTGSNVALNISEGKNKKNNLESRIKGIELYLEYYEILEKVISKNRYNTINYKRYKDNGENRITYLKEVSLFKYVRNIININYYPSKKAYIKDGFLLFKLKLIRK